MKQKLLSIALLACFSGFASASLALEVEEGSLYQQDVNITGESFNNKGTIENDSVVISENTSFTNTGDIKTGIFDLSTSHQNPVFSGSITLVQVEITKNLNLMPFYLPHYFKSSGKIAKQVF